MLWSFGRRNRFEESGEAARRVHGQWLTKALRSPRAMPRIPVFPVNEGGVETVMNTPEGRVWVEGWWSHTLETSDLEL